jgi:hypothetical protein
MSSLQKEAGEGRSISECDSAPASVGYGKPPRKYRFKKGQSGNPRGRPRGSRSFLTLLAQELDRLVAVNDGGRIKKIPKRIAIVRQLTDLAAQGDARALKALMTCMSLTDPSEDAEAKERENAAIKSLVELLDEAAKAKLKSAASSDGES